MEVITLSSDSEEDGSDVEIIDHFLSRTDPLPLRRDVVVLSGREPPSVNAPTVRS